MALNAAVSRFADNVQGLASPRQEDNVSTRIFAKKNYTPAWRLDKV